MVNQIGLMTNLADSTLLRMCHPIEAGSFAMLRPQTQMKCFKALDYLLVQEAEMRTQTKEERLDGRTMVEEAHRAKEGVQKRDSNPLFAKKVLPKVRQEVLPMKAAHQERVDKKKKELSCMGAFFLLLLTVLTVAMVQSRVLLFRTKAVGRWGDGKAYNFSYPWCLTLFCFLSQIGILLVSACFATFTAPNTRKISP